MSAASFYQLCITELLEKLASHSHRGIVYDVEHGQRAHRIVPIQHPIPSYHPPHHPPHHHPIVTVTRQSQSSIQQAFLYIILAYKLLTTLFEIVNLGYRKPIDPILLGFGCYNVVFIPSLYYLPRWKYTHTKMEQLISVYYAFILCGLLFITMVELFTIGNHHFYLHSWIEYVPHLLEFCFSCMIIAMIGIGIGGGILYNCIRSCC